MSISNFTLKSSKKFAKKSDSDYNYLCFYVCLFLMVITKSESQENIEQKTQWLDNISDIQEETKEAVAASLHTPKFIRDFSKKNRREERNALAKKIMDQRRKMEENPVKKKSLAAQKQPHEKNLENQQALLNANEEALKKLDEEILKINRFFLSEWLNYFKNKELLAKKGLLKEKSETVKSIIRDIDSKIELIQQQEWLITQEETHYFDIEQELKEFYENEKKEWEKPGWDKEEVKKYFTEEYLSKLSLDDYILLLKRFPNHLLTHVTRQGVRDHVSHHFAGEWTFFNGFVDILKQWRLKSTLWVAFADSKKQELLKDYIIKNICSRALNSEISINGKINNKEEAIENLDFHLDPKQSFFASFYDSSALHTAVDFVPDSYYWWEKNNEFFFIFPSIMVASQYRFIGPLHESSRDNHDDKWIWTKECQWIDINSMIAFIPKNTMVDKNTWSQYELDSEKKPIVLQDKTLKKSSNTVTSFEYRENFFKNNAHLKPSKVMYYEWTPNDALEKWKEENWLNKISESDDFWFSENNAWKFPEIKNGDDSYQISQNVNKRKGEIVSSYLSEEIKEFRNIALEIINEYYSNIENEKSEKNILESMN